MNFSLEFPVRSYELDGYGHVNNAVYLQYFEYARAAFLLHIGFDLKQLHEAGYAFYVTQAHIHYRTAVHLFDTLRALVKPLKLGKASGVFSQTLENQHHVLCADAEITWVCVSRTSGKPTKIPPEYLVPALYPNY